jgi:hypothetical protein
VSPTAFVKTNLWTRRSWPPLSVGDWEADMLKTQNATQPLVHARPQTRRVTWPVPGRSRGKFAPRIVAVAAITWVVAWGCIGALMYLQDEPAPYVLDREND